MQKRTVSLYSIICLLLVSLVLRTVVLGQTFTSDVLESAHTRTLPIGTTRGKIYACDLSPLVDRAANLIAAVAPCPAAQNALRTLLGADAAAAITAQGTPQAAALPAAINNDFIRTFSVPVRTDNTTPALHLVGTLDSSGNGSAGIEKGCNDVLRTAGGSLAVRFQVDAAGRALPGGDKVILDDNFNAPNGVVLTVDPAVQTIAETALQHSRIQSGCVLVTEIGSGAIRAMESVPRFDPQNLSAALQAADTPLLNKALQAYSAGSVFKPLVAAYALEHGISPKTTFVCNGSCRVGGTVFHCWNSKAHGRETMAQALKNSCNTYFIRLMEQLNAGDFLAFCKAIGLGSPTDLDGGIRGAAGALPAETALRSPGARANFAFGQGDLLLTPVQLSAVYHVLATGDICAPTVLAGMTDDGKTLQPTAPRQRFRLLSAQTVSRLRRLLYAAANSSTANARSDRCAIAGKTGTAQSGSFQNGVELCRTWFAGFVPADAPRYIVVVMNEHGSSGNADCAPVAREICEAIAAR